MNDYIKRCLFALSTLCLCFALYTPAQAQVVITTGHPHHHHHRRHHHHPYHQ